MRIVFVNPVAQVGGAEMILLDLLAALADAIPGVDRHLIVAGEGPLIDLARAIGVVVHPRPMPDRLAGLGDSALKGRGKVGAILGLAARGAPAGLAGLRYARGLGRLIREIGPDLIHSNGIKSHLLLRLSGLRGIPVVWHLHDFYGTRPVMARALRWASRGAAGAIAISEAVGRDGRRVLDPLPVQVVYNAVDVEQFTPGPGDGARLDALANLPPAAPGAHRVGLIATYARWKGQDLFLRAAARLAGDRPARFYVIGSPIYQTKGSQWSEAELRGLAGSLGLEDRVGFIPFQRDTAAVYRALDVVVHASTQPEPFGRTIIEAMACGRPVVVSDAGGAAELFQDGRDAVGFPPGDTPALAAAILGLVDDPGRRERIGRAARATAVERFARPRLGVEVAAAYERFRGRVISPRPAG